MTEMNEKLWIVVLLVAGVTSAVIIGQAPRNPTNVSPSIPRVWDEELLRTMELPLASPAPQPTHVTSAYYYSIPVLTIYKSYPIEAAGRERAEYRRWLEQQEPQVAFDVATLKTEADWIAAGQIVFETSQQYRPAPAGAVVDPRPFDRFYVREKGKVEWGFTGCNQCHSRRLPDGTVVNGAQSDRVFRDTDPPASRPAPGIAIIVNQAVTDSTRRFYATPWFDPDPNLGPSLDRNTPGTSARAGAPYRAPMQIPDLIGIKDRKYLDHTGLQQHRSIGDLMRYAAFATAFGMERYKNYAGWIPYGVNFRTLPDPATLVRFSDEQLFALALYLYSLEPPPNPNRPNATSAAGEEVFRREGCIACHTPPLYTSNRLIPADGFTPPPDHREKYAIVNARVGLDSFLALKTRRATGYYKVPSLKGVWYRGPFEHHGSVMTLEDWLDPRRLRDDYVPSGWKGLTPTRAVTGHVFGLKISADDKTALIAFLKTL